MNSKAWNPRFEARTYPDDREYCLFEDWSSSAELKLTEKTFLAFDIICWIKDKSQDQPVTLAAVSLRQQVSFPCVGDFLPAGKIMKRIPSWQASVFFSTTWRTTWCRGVDG